MQPPASIQAAEAARTGAAWDWLVDNSVAEGKQAVHDIAYKVRVKYLKNLEVDLTYMANYSYTSIHMF